MVCTWHLQRSYTMSYVHKLSATCMAWNWTFMNLTFRVAFFFCFQLKLPRPQTPYDTVLMPTPTSSGTSFLVPPLWKRTFFSRMYFSSSWRNSSAGSYFPNYQRRGPLCSIVGAMVSHVGHINTGDQASVTHSWVCSSPKAPARLVPMQTTLPIPHLNHTGFL